MTNDRFSYTLPEDGAVFSGMTEKNVSKVRDGLEKSLYPDRHLTPDEIREINLRRLKEMIQNGEIKPWRHGR